MPQLQRTTHSDSDSHSSPFIAQHLAERVRVARALADLPLTCDAFREGRVSYSKVRAITRAATPQGTGLGYGTGHPRFFCCF